jgi:signal transduction histidine kinase
MKWRLSLTARIALVVVLSLAAAWIGSVAVFYMSMVHQGRSLRPLPAQIAALVELLEHTPPAERPSVLRAVTSYTMTARLEPGMHISATAASQRVSRLTARAVKPYLSDLGGRPSSVTASGFTFVTPVALELRVGLETGDTLIVDVNRAPVTSVLGLPVGFVAGLLGTVIGLAALIATRRQILPLAELAAAVDRFDPVETPAPPLALRAGAPEIRALIAAFERLQSRLSHLLVGRMAMLGGISHDVRTFATRLRLRAELIPNPIERERAAEDIGDMIRLLDDALLASRAGAGELAEELVELDQLVNAEVAARRAEGNAVELRESQAQLECSVLGDRLALRRIVTNLIDNALKYGGSARLSLQAGNGFAELTVDDAGPGIPRQLRKIVLEPFVRMDDSRSRRTGGAGLGLAVVRTLVEAHRGTVRISDAPGGGGRVIVCLPLFG